MKLIKITFSSSKFKSRLYALIILATVIVILDTLFRIVPFPLSIVIIVASALSLQSFFTLTWMLYVWNAPHLLAPSLYKFEMLPPKYSFTALLPARHESIVIGDTIRAINAIHYPTKLKEIIVLCRLDDAETIKAAKTTIESLNNPNIRLVTFSGYPINKPYALNVGLSNTNNEIVTIFDAEDQPHPNLYRIIDTNLQKHPCDVIQSGVQLMNYTSHWFSALNVLEYYFWFKSGLHFFTRYGHVTPLGGNTVFFKKTFLEKVGGWDDKCLTEDADIGIRLTLAGARIKVIYDEEYVTQEETPSSINSFIKQRTRWNQGFLQIFQNGYWRRLNLRQQLVTLYILLSPLTQVFLLLYIPFSLWIGFTQKLPVLIALYSFIPLYLFIIQLAIYLFGLIHFIKVYRLTLPFWLPLKFLATFVPYQLMLAYASFRAFVRTINGNTGWEKTLHTNQHRIAILATE